MKRFSARLGQILCCIMLLSAAILPARADTGPKPSVTVTLEGLGGRVCYATLLSEQESTGPSWAAKPGQPLEFPLDTSEEERLAWKQFRAYSEDEALSDFYFLQEAWDASSGSFKWGYYPPYTFQIALWFPAEQVLVVSNTCQRYAFDSYYTLDLSSLSFMPRGMIRGVEAVQSYDHSGELSGLCCRILITVALELLAAWCFRIRSHGAVLSVLAVNLLTQTALNAGLNLYAYQNGPGYLFLPYLMMEAGVLAAEFLCYCILPVTGRDKKRAFRYALAANLLSLAAGWWLAHVLPGVF